MIHTDATAAFATEPRQLASVNIHFTSRFGATGEGFDYLAHRPCIQNLDIFWDIGGERNPILLLIEFFITTLALFFLGEINRGIKHPLRRRQRDRLKLVALNPTNGTRWAGADNVHENKLVVDNAGESTSGQTPLVSALLILLAPQLNCRLPFLLLALHTVEL